MYSKRYLFLFRSAPQKNCRTSELLDNVLTVAAFDQPVTVLFLDDGVYCLKSNSSPEDTHRFSVSFSSLAFYAIRDTLVEYESLKERRLTVLDCSIAATVIYRSEIAGLVATHDYVVST